MRRSPQSALIAVCCLAAYAGASTPPLDCSQAKDAAVRVLSLMASSARDDQSALRPLVASGAETVHDSVTVIRSYRVIDCRASSAEPAASVTIEFETIGRVVPSGDPGDFDFIPLEKKDRLVLEVKDVDGHPIVDDISKREPHVFPRYARNIFVELQQDAGKRAKGYREIQERLERAEGLLTPPSSVTR